MAEEMTVEELKAFLEIAPEEHFRSKEKASKAASIWKALADASADTEEKAQWQSASDNAMTAAKEMMPAYAHNAGVALKKELKEARKELGTSEEDQRDAAVLDCFGALADLMINERPKKT